MQIRRMLAVAAFVACGGLLLSAQQDSQGQPPTFRTGVELVTVDVSVLDRQGLPLRDLTPADFMVSVARQATACRVRRVRRHGRCAQSEHAGARWRAHQQQRRRGHRPPIRLHRRSAHARDRQRAARRECRGAILHQSDVRRSLGIDAHAGWTEHQFHLGARSRSHRAAAGHRDELAHGDVGVWQPHRRPRHCQPQHDGPAHRGRTRVSRLDIRRRIRRRWRWGWRSAEPRRHRVVAAVGWWWWQRAAGRWHRWWERRRHRGADRRRWRLDGRRRRYGNPARERVWRRWTAARATSRCRPSPPGVPRR